MKLILILAFALLPIICLAEDQSDNKTINKNLVIKLKSECSYDIQCVIGVKDIENALPENFGPVSLPIDLDITSFKSGNGIDIKNYSINKDGIIFIMPSKNIYKEKKEEFVLDGIDSIDGAYFIKYYNTKDFKNMTFYDDMINIYRIKNDHIIKGFLNKRQIIIHVNIFWYFTVYDN